MFKNVDLLAFREIVVSRPVVSEESFRKIFLFISCENSKDIFIHLVKKTPP